MKPIKGLNITQEQIKMEFTLAFFVNGAPNLEGVFSGNIDTNLINCSSECRHAEENLEILWRVEKILASGILNYGTTQTNNLEDEEQNYYTEVDGIYGGEECKV